MAGQSMHRSTRRGWIVPSKTSTEATWCLVESPPEVLEPRRRQLRITPIGARLHACKMQGKTTQVAAAVMSVATQSKFRLRIPSAPWGVTITHGLQQKKLAYLPLARADLALPGPVRRRPVR